MKFAPTDECFIEHRHGSVFFPWAGFFALGALWAYDVPTAESPGSLVRQVRAFHLTAFIIWVVTVVTGLWLEAVIPCIGVALVVHLFVYSMVVHRHLKSLVRLPLQLSVSIFAARFGRIRLCHNILLGGLCVIFTILYPVKNIVFLAMTTGLAANSLVALCLLQRGCE